LGPRRLYTEPVQNDEAGVRLVALGVPVTVRFLGDGAGEAVEGFRDVWSWCLAGPDSSEAASDPVVIDVHLDDHPRVVPAANDAAGQDGQQAAPSLPHLLDRLSSTITVEVIGRQAGRLLMLHACALAHPETGATVVMVGGSGAGKTTAARTLGTTLGYVTDETAGIGPDDSVVPYPKPLSLLRSGADTLKEQASPSTLGLIPPAVDPWVAAVVLLERDLAAPPDPQVEGVRHVRALAELAPHTSFLSRMETPLQRLASLLHESGGLRRVTYSEAADLEPVVKELLGRTR
jgi:hypothetical protein